MRRAGMIGTTLLAHHAVAIGFENNRGNFGGTHPTSGHMGQEVTFLFGEASHNLGVALHARFEVIEKEAELAAEASELTPATGELAGDRDSETIHHHLSCDEARRVLAISPLPSLLVFPIPTT